jgi:hypothetical protein
MSRDQAQPFQSIRLQRNDSGPMGFCPSWFETDFARLKLNSCPFEAQGFVWPQTHKSTQNEPTQDVKPSLRASAVKQSREFLLLQDRRPGSLDPRFVYAQNRILGRRTDFESVAEQIGKSRAMIYKFLGGIPGEVRLISCFVTAWIG